MRVAHFLVRKVNDETIFSADFIFKKHLGNKKARVISLVQSIWNAVKHPSNFYENGLTTTKHIWFSVPSKLANTIQYENAFYAIAIGLSTFLNEDLLFEGMISPDLIRRTSRIKKYFNYEKNRRNIKVSYQTGKSHSSSSEEVAQFFTLGVDSFHTLLCHQTSEKKPRYLIYVDGFDVPLNKVGFLEEIHHRITNVAQVTKNKPVFVKSNLREISDDIIGWGQFHVSALTAVGMLLICNKIYINGETFDWPDWGLRSGVDSLFSLNQTSFELVAHNVRRDITIKKISQSPFFSLFLQNVRVCWQNITIANTPYNCSSCQKCLRTQLTLLALGIPKTPTFQNFQISKLQDLSLNIHIYPEWQILYKLFKKQTPANLDLISAIKQLIDKPVFTVAPIEKEINNLFFNSTKI